ncbi:MAG: hypothetical protein U0790_24065 [Isosphaeraceae bacterium]
MKRSMSLVSVRTLRRSVALVPALAICVVSSGCAGWSSWGDRRSAWTMPSWKRSAPGTDTPGYDLYADAAGGARPQSGDPVVAARRGGPSNSRPTAEAA